MTYPHPTPPVRSRLPRLGASICLGALLAGSILPALGNGGPLYWNGTNSAPTQPGGDGGDGTWSNDPSFVNWTNEQGTINTNWIAGDPAIFGGTTGTVTLDGSISVQSLHFTVDGYAISGSGAGDEIAISGANLSILTDSGTAATITAPITGAGGMIKNGDGTLVLTADNTYTGNTDIVGGTVLVDGDSPFGVGGSLTLRNGTTLGVVDGGLTMLDNEVHIDGDVKLYGGLSGDALEFAGQVHLGNARRTLTFTGDGEVCFMNTIDGTGGLTLRADPSVLAVVMMCGLDGNTYTGLTTIGDGVALVLLKDPGVQAIQGDVLIEDGALLSLEFTPDQINTSSRITVNGSLGITAAGDADMQQIGDLRGNGYIVNYLDAATLRIASGNFSGEIYEDGGADALTIVKNGSGTLILSGENYHTGGTIIEAGRLIARNEYALGDGPVTLNGGTLEPVASLTIESLTWNGGTIAMALDSGGDIYVYGPLTMTADGHFSFSDLTPNYTYTLLTYDTAGSTLFPFFSTVDGMVTPQFQIVDNGDGTTSILVTFTGGATTGPVLSNAAPYYTPYDADFFVNGPVTTWPVNGYNVVNSLLFASGSSLQVFDELEVTSGNFTVQGGTATITGGDVYVPGNFTKLGSGTLIANSDFEIYGAANIVSGGLYVNGFFYTVDGVNVFSGATLGGSGYIVGNVVNNGIVAPGNSPGSLLIEGDFTQTSSGTLQIEVASGSVFDELIVFGTATLGGTLEIQNFNGNTLSYGQQIPFLYADSIEGDFDQIVMPDPSIFRGRFLNEDGEGILLVAPTSYTLVAETQNQRNVAAALDGFIPATSGDRQEVSIALDVMTADQYPAAFDQISPAFYESLADITLEQNNAQNQMLAQRFSSVRLGARGFQSMGVAQSPIVNDKDGKSVLDAKSTKDIITPTEDNKWGVWVMGNGLFANAPSVNQMPSYKVQSGGFLGGVDYAWSEHFATGVFAGYQGLYAKYNGGAKNTINSTNFGTYATFQHSGFTADAIVSGAYNNYSTRRPIEFSTVDRTATANPDGGQVNAYLGLGYDWQVGNFTFGPILSAQYTYVGIGSFTENNAGSLDLKVDQQNAHSIRTSVGGRIAYTWKLTEHITLIPEGRMLWQHEYLNGPRTIGASLDGGAGSGFDYLTAAPGRDAVYAGAGVTAQFGPNWNANLFYNADFGRQDYISHMVSGGLTWEF